MLWRAIVRPRAACSTHNFKVGVVVRAAALYLLLLLSPVGKNQRKVHVLDSSCSGQPHAAWIEVGLRTPHEHWGLHSHHLAKCCCLGMSELSDGS